MQGEAERIDIAPVEAAGDADWACASHMGLLRLTNEDYVLARPRLGLWLICDGLGGHGRGDEASRLAATRVAASVERGRGLRQAILNADDGLRNYFQVDEDVWPAPGTTIVVLRLTPDRWRMAWLGDSRGYVWDETGLRQVTRDHSKVQQMIDAGELTPAEARAHPWRNIVTQAVGLGATAAYSEILNGPGLNIGLAEGPRLPGRQVFLLATDGLADADDPAILARRLHRSHNATDAARRLIQASLAAGGADNVSVCVVGWK